MEGACSTHRRDENAYIILVGKPEGGDHLEDLGIDERITFKWIKLDWIHLAQDRVQWRVLVNTVMDLLVR
jgi:hypothetical protein